MLRLAAAALLCFVAHPIAVAAARAAECREIPLAALDGDGSFANLQTRTPMPLRPAKPVARYEISAILDPASHTIRASQRLHWRNRSNQAVCTLYFHQDINAFESEGSRYMLSQHARGAVPKVKRGEWGYGQITQLRHSDMDASWSYVYMDDSLRADHTVVRVELPEPVLPGTTTVIEMGFVTRLPGDWARSGHAGPFHFASHWFPQIATLQLPGERGAPELRWNAPAFAGEPVEREHADFDVHFEVPYDLVAVSSGETKAVTRSRNGRRSYHFVHEDAATLAWAADSNFFAQPLVYPYVAPDGKRVALRVFYRPGHAATAVSMLGGMADALASYTASLGAYPDAALTAVVAPRNADSLATQAVPGLFVATAAPASAYANAALRRQVFAAVGSSYVPEGTDPVFRAGVLRYWISRFLPSRDAVPQDRKTAWLHSLVAPWRALVSQHRSRMREFEDFDATRANFVADVLRDLEIRIGAQSIDSAFRAWRRSSRAGYPDTGQVRWVMEDRSGEADAFQQAFAIMDAGLPVDDRIVRFVSDVQRPHVGYSLRGTSRAEVTEEDVRRELREARTRSKSGPPGVGNVPYRTEVIVQRNGAVVPQTLVVTFADGSSRSVQWDHHRNPVRFEWFTASPALSVQLDPQRQIALDRDRLDDGRMLRTDMGATRRWSEQIAAFVQVMTSWLATM